MAWGAVAGVIGPLAGGLIVDQLTWRWVFALNIPLVVATLVLIRGACRRYRPSRDRRSTSSARLCTIGLGGVVFAFIEQPHYGWGSATTSCRWPAASWRSPSSSLHERRHRSRC